jgi:ankyrin repeat protein
MCFRQLESQHILNEDGTVTVIPHPYETLSQAASAGNIAHITNYLDEHKDFHIDNSFSYGNTLLKIAVNSNQYDAVKFLVNEHHADPYYSHGVPTGDDHHYISVNMHSACHGANQQGDLQMIDLLGGCAAKAGTDVVE